MTPVPFFIDPRPFFNMPWKLRACLLRNMARWPGGYTAYQLLQRRLGALRRPSYWKQKLRWQADLAQQAMQSGAVIEDARVVEVGAGWLPLAPMGFWICGAREIVTYDLNRHLLPDMLRKVLHWMAESEAELIALYDGVASPQRVRDCLQKIREHADRPWRLLEVAGIRYQAPADATDTGLDAGSVDLHYSLSVLEHIPRATIADLLHEARRVLKPTGRCVHLIDPKDHFAMTDRSISSINFLHFSDAEWNRYAGNFLAYHNRLRDRDFVELFEQAGFELLAHRYEVDARALALLKNGFPLAEPFRDLDAEQLCRNELLLVAGLCSRVGVANL